MLTRSEYEGGVWIDLERPTEEEVRAVAEEFEISERFQAELLSPTPSARVASGTDMVLLVLHFPSPGAVDGEMEYQELDFIVGRHFIITAHYDFVAPIHELKKQLETQTLVGSEIHLTTEILLEILFAHVYTSVRDAANYAAQNLARVEAAMFKDRERMTIRLISNISREFLHMEAALVGHEELLEDFLTMLKEHKFFSPAFKERSERMLRERTQVARLAGTHRAVATELRETNNALLNAKQNEIVKILTVVSFIFLPLALIAKIFSMKVEEMPFIHDPNGFWIILAIMGVIALLITLFVARKRWI